MRKNLVFGFAGCVAIWYLVWQDARNSLVWQDARNSLVWQDARNRLVWQNAQIGRMRKLRKLVVWFGRIPVTV
jgi:hypothetical protein